MCLVLMVLEVVLVVLEVVPQLLLLQLLLLQLRVLLKLPFPRGVGNFFVRLPNVFSGADDERHAAWAMSPPLNR